MADRDDERQRQLVREALADEHRARARRAPPFERLWAQAAATAEGARTAGRRRPRIRLAVAAALAALVGAVAVGLWLDVRRGSQQDRALRLAAAVGEWRAPLDFLLDTPGREWLESTPSWDPRAATGPRWGALPDPLPPSDSANPSSPQEANP